MNKILFKIYLKRLINEQLDILGNKISLDKNKFRGSFVSSTLNGARKLEFSSELLGILKHILEILIKLDSGEYNKSQAGILIKAIRDILFSDKTQGISEKPRTKDDLVRYINKEFLNGDPVGSIIQDYAGYKYKVWKFNKSFAHMVCEDLADHKVYIVETEELLKGFDKA